MTEQTQHIINKLKNIVERYDKKAQIIFFGSRARGDWHEESDWDFLILTNLPEQSEIKEQVRKDILNEIELTTFETINIIWHNKQVWEDDYAVTNIYQSIKEEGVEV